MMWHHVISVRKGLVVKLRVVLALLKYYRELHLAIQLDLP